MYIESCSAGEARPADTRGLPDSLISTNNSLTRRVRVPTHDMYKTRWRNGEIYLSLDPEIQRHYWAASMLLPIGTVFVLALVVLLMVLFKRCPQMVAAIVASILGIIIIFTALMSINHAPIYA